MILLSLSPFFVTIDIVYFGMIDIIPINGGKYDKNYLWPKIYKRNSSPKRGGGK